MKKLLTITIGALVFVAVITQVASIYISNTAAIDSIEVSKLKEKIVKIEESNMQLEAEVLANSSYFDVASRAAELGYSTTRDIISVYDPVQVARAQ